MPSITSNLKSLVKRCDSSLSQTNEGQEESSEIIPRLRGPTNAVLGINPYLPNFDALNSDTDTFFLVYSY